MQIRIVTRLRSKGLRQCCEFGIQIFFGPKKFKLEKILGQFFIPRRSTRTIIPNLTTPRTGLKVPCGRVGV